MPARGTDECPHVVVAEPVWESAYEAYLAVEVDRLYAYEPDLEVELELVADDLAEEWFGEYDETREYIAPFETFDEQPTSPFRRFGKWLLGRAAA